MTSSLAAVLRKMGTGGGGRLQRGPSLSKALGDSRIPQLSIGSSELVAQPLTFASIKLVT